MRCAALSIFLLAGASPAYAAPPPEAEPPTEETGGDPSEDSAAQIAKAVEAWTAGNWAETRRLLAPLADAPETVSDPFERERVLRFMADATLLDPELDPASAQQLARAYVGRLLDEDAQWTPPPGAHSDQLYQVTAELKEARRRERAAACEAELVACSASVENEKTLRERLQVKHDQLQADYEDEMVLVTDRVALNRAVALVPFGVGHFYNRNKVLGATFLSSELAFGGVGLGLLLYRTVGLNCTRTNGFQEGSLQCVNDRVDHTIRVRNAEQTFGILFLGTLVVDVVLAQVLFKDSRIVGQRRVRRGDLEELNDGQSVEELPASDEEKPATEASGAKFQIRPTSTIHRGGAGFGVRMRF